MCPSPTSSAPEIELDRELGSGSSGTVFHGVLKRPYESWPAGTEVAVKVLHKTLRRDLHAIRGFETEAEVAEAVQHENLVRVLHVGERDGSPAIVMRYVPGRTLREELRLTGPCPEPLVRSIGRQLAGALAALHAAGWRHGDVKPENVRLFAAGQVVLIDLGFARPLSATGEALPATGPLAGSLAYLSPEEAGGAAGGAASDLFALGILLFELATGVHPFLGTSVEGVSSQAPRGADQTLAALTLGGSPPPSSLAPQLSPFFDHLVGALFARDPRNRPSAAGLGRWLAEGEAGAWWRQRIDFAAGATRELSIFSQRHALPLVGREQELAEMITAFENAIASGGPGTALWLEAPEGGGKSRLLEEFALRVRAREVPPLVLHARCGDWIEERPAAPLVKLLRRYLHLPRRTPAGPRERALLERIVPPIEAETLFAALAPETTEVTQASVPAALATFLLRLADVGPLAVLVDDIVLAGPGTLDVLARVARELAESPLFFVLGRRSGAIPREHQAFRNLEQRLARSGHAKHLRLEPLDEAQVLELVERRFHTSAPRLRLARVLSDRTGGQPGQLVELLTELDRGKRSFFADDGPRNLTIAPEDLPTPRSVERAATEDYARLPEVERHWLRRLAVAAGRIETGFLMRAFGEDESQRPEIEAVLARLAQAGWLVPVAARYRFANPAQRAVIYRSLAPEERVRLHQSAAASLASEDEPPSLATDFQRAFHLREAGSHFELLELLPALVRATAHRGHPQRVRTLARWGLEALAQSQASGPDRPETLRMRIDFLEAAIDAADRLGAREDQRVWLDALTDLPLNVEQDAVGAGRIYLLHGRYAASTAQYGLARSCLRNAASFFERAGEREHQSEALRRLAEVQSRAGEFASARNLAEKALALATEPTGFASCRLVLALLDLLDDRFEAALLNAEKAMQELRTEQRVQTSALEAQVHLMRARTYRLLGRPRRALGSLQRCLRLARRAGMRPLEAEASARHGGLLLELDREREAELVLRDALFSAQEIEDRRAEALATLFLGVLLGEAERPDADEMLARAARLAGDIGLHREEALAIAMTARIARKNGDNHLALERSARALELLEHFGAELADRLVIVGTRALVLTEAGERSAVRDLERPLRRRVRRENARIESAILRKRHRRFSARLFASARSPEGPVYPRIRGIETDSH